MAIRDRISVNHPANMCWRRAASLEIQPQSFEVRTFSTHHAARSLVSTTVTHSWRTLVSHLLRSFTLAKYYSRPAIRNCKSKPMEDNSAVARKMWTKIEQGGQDRQLFHFRLQCYARISH